MRSSAFGLRMFCWTATLRIQDVDSRRSSLRRSWSLLIRRHEGNCQHTSGTAHAGLGSAYTESADVETLGTSMCGAQGPRPALPCALRAGTRRSVVYPVLGVGSPNERGRGIPAGSSPGTTERRGPSQDPNFVSG